MRATTHALAVLARPERGGKTLTLFNPLGFEYTGPVHARLPKGTTALADGDGNRIPVQTLDDEHALVADGIRAFASRHYRILKSPTQPNDASAVQATARLHLVTLNISFCK